MHTDPREEAALDAVVAYSLAGKPFENFSDDEIEQELSNYAELSPEGRACLEKMGEKPFSKKTTSPRAETVRLEEVAGMYREGSDQDLSPELREEIARKRESIRAQLRKKREGDV